MKGLNQRATELAEFLDNRGYSGAGDEIMKMAGTINRLEAENAALREKIEAAVKNMCAYCTSEKWDHGCDPNCHRCEWKEMHNKVFGGQEGAKE